MVNRWTNDPTRNGAETRTTHDPTIPQGVPVVEIVAVGGFVATGAPVPRTDEPEETCYDDIEFKFTGETLIRWLPHAPVIKRRRPRQPRTIGKSVSSLLSPPLLTIEPSQLILAHQSVSDVRFDGTTTIEWHPWEGVRARDDETALLYMLFRQ